MFSLALGDAIAGEWIERSLVRKSLGLLPPVTLLQCLLELLGVVKGDSGLVNCSCS